MLEDYRKVMVDRRGEEEQFTSDHIAECMKRGNDIFILFFVYGYLFLLNSSVFLLYLSQLAYTQVGLNLCSY